MELPTYQLPSWRNCLIRAWFNLRGFIVRAGQVIIIIAVALALLRAVSAGITSHNKEKNQPRRDVSERIALAMVPVFEPMGIDENNWQAVIGLMTGILAKESVIGTLDVVYAQSSRKTLAEKESENAFAFKKPFVTLLKQLAADYGFIEESDDDHANTGLLSELRKHFNNGAAAFAYLLFVLIYSPCIAALAVLGREAGWRWMWFSLAYQTMLAWVCATAFYQAATFSQQPRQATLWLTISAAIVMTTVIGLAIKGRQGGFEIKPVARRGGK